MNAKRIPFQKQAIFSCPVNPDAQAAYLVGDFNDWDPTAAPMEKQKTGVFQVKLKLPPGEYQYKFIVDGIWFNDPNAEKQAINPYGTLNSIIRVE